MAKRISEQHYFFTKDGHTLTSRDDMLGFLKETSDHVFHEHVNAQRNDFASWTADILKKKSLAKKMQACHTRSDMVRVVQESVKKKRRPSKDKKSIIAQLVDAITS